MVRIGVDVGGTKIEAVRVTADGTIEAKERCPTEADTDRDQVLGNLKSCIRAVWSDAVEAIGVALPGFFRDGTVAFNPNIEPLVGCRLIEELEAEFGVPVLCENDADCFALAEHRLGAGKGSRHMVGVILGTGVGGGIIIDGKLYIGATDAAGEIGHMRIADGTRWEDLLSGPAIVRRYREAGGEAAEDPAGIWESDDDVAVRIKAETVRLAGIFLANLVNAFNPEVIVLGGGVSNLPFLDDIRSAAEEHCVPGAFEAVRIERYALADSAGAVGATLLHD